MSLSEQVESLATFAFGSAYLYIVHGNACFTGPLYADAQAVVKNIIFTIARMQQINPDMCLYIIHEGTDRLEGLFSDTHTLDHARNFDIDQLSGKLSVATLINAAFQRNPDLDRGHRRLSLKGAMGIDHVNPKSWEGDTHVGNVDLKSTWKNGQQAAERMLSQFFGKNISFNDLFSKPEHDLMRPLGEYIGISATTEDTRSEEENSTPLNISRFTSQTPDVEVEKANSQISEDATVDDLDASESSSPEEINDSQERNSNSQDQFASEIPSDNNTVDNEITTYDPDFGMDLDNFFPGSEDNESDGEQMSKSTDISKTITVDGKTYLKSSLVALLSTNRSKKASICTLRVRGVALDDLHKSRFEDLDQRNLEDEDLVKKGDLVATLVRCDSIICMAVLEIAAFSFANERGLKTVASLDDLERRDKQITVTGQVIDLQMPSSQANHWQWTGRYLQLTAHKKDKKKTRQQFTLDVPSFLLCPLAPSIITAPSTTSITGLKLRYPTWQLTDSELIKVLTFMWDQMEPESEAVVENIASLPIIKNSVVLPYQNSEKQNALLVKSLPQTFGIYNGKDKYPCLICKKCTTSNVKSCWLSHITQTSKYQ